MAKRDYVSTETPAVVMNARKIAQCSKSSPDTLADVVAKYGHDFEVSIRSVQNCNADAKVWKLSMVRANETFKLLERMKKERAELVADRNDKVSQKSDMATKKLYNAMKELEKVIRELDEDMKWHDKTVKKLEENLHSLTRILAERVGLLKELPCAEEKTSLMFQLLSLGCEDLTTRKNLARYTDCEKVKVHLYRSTSNEEIRGICLKRFHDMKTLMRYLSKLSGDLLYKYADSILRNTHLTKEALKSFIEASVMLDDEHIELIINNANYNEEEFAELLSRFKKPTITHK